MKIASVSEIQNLDKQTIEVLGIPGLVLMERAALGAFSVIQDKFRNLLRSDKPVVIAVGSGNNGGDGLALGRMIHQTGKNVIIFTFAPEDKSSPDNITQLKICRSLGLTIIPYSLKEFADYIKDASLIVDSLFGVGLAREVKGIFEEAINEMNNSGKPVIALDIPSGIHGDTGQALGIACRCDNTVTFALPKYGLMMDNAVDYVGNLSIIDIGIPTSYSKNLKGNLLSSDEVASIIPQRRKLNSHKGTYGKIFIIAGSQMMSGAAVLSAKAALNSGAGLVYIGVPSSIRETVAISVPSAIVIPLPEDEKGRVCLASYDAIAEQLAKSDAFAIGPGLGVTEEISSLITKITDNFKIPVVIDADGLNNLAQSGNFKLPSNVILTPHVAELGRLTGATIAEIQSNRLSYACQAAEKFNCTMVLKGSRTIIADPNGTNWINTSGNPGMAKGGSGDVLTGLMVGLLGQKLSSLDAAKCAVYWHGRAGDIAADKTGQTCMSPEDIVDNLAEAYKTLV